MPGGHGGLPVGPASKVETESPEQALGFIERTCLNESGGRTTQEDSQCRSWAATCMHTGNTHANMHTHTTHIYHEKEKKKT